MSETASLAILLDAPLMAWGSSSRFQYRETEAFPTKSALIGLLAAALRIDKHASDEAERLAPVAALRVSCCAVPKGRKGKLLRLVDFHTVGGGYDKSASAMEKMSIPRKASGPPFGTVITRRTYLTGTRFVAVFTGGAATIAEAASALKNPAWGVWLGRKACLPALPLAPTVADDPGKALTRLLSRLAEWDGADQPDSATLERWEEPENPDPAKGDFFLPDSPTSFGERRYSGRPVRHVRASESHPVRLADGVDVAAAFFDGLPETDVAAWESSEVNFAPEPAEE